MTLRSARSRLVSLRSSKRQTWAPGLLFGASVALTLVAATLVAVPSSAQPDQSPELATPPTPRVTDAVNGVIGDLPPDPGEAGLRLLRQAIEAHGGNPYEDLDDIAVSFAGRWGRIGPRLQPILADRDFRVASEERYLLKQGVTFQWHVGPDGEKIVYREPGAIEVFYNGRRNRDPNRVSASAATADLYGLLLIGPAWITQRETTATIVGERELGDEMHTLLEVVIRPGLGLGESDSLVLWLSKETTVLHRVEGTLSGFAPLEGRRLEVTMGGHRWLAGKLWPTEFLQRVDAAVKVAYHRWQLTGFDSGRGLNQEELRQIHRSRPEISALRPAALVAPVVDPEPPER